MLTSTNDGSFIPDKRESHELPQVGIEWGEGCKLISWHYSNMATSSRVVMERDCRGYRGIREEPGGLIA